MINLILFYQMTIPESMFYLDPTHYNLNIIYNIADVLNKIAFGVIIWNVAVAGSESK